MSHVADVASAAIASWRGASKRVDVGCRTVVRCVPSKGRKTNPDPQIGEHSRLYVGHYLVSSTGEAG